MCEQELVTYGCKHEKLTDAFKTCEKYRNTRKYCSDAKKVPKQEEKCCSQKCCPYNRAREAVTAWEGTDFDRMTVKEAEECRRRIKKDEAELKRIIEKRKACLSTMF